MSDTYTEIPYQEDTGTLQWEGEDVLHWSIQFPDFSQSKTIHKRLKQYYKKVSHIWEKHWQEKVYPQVCQELQEKRQISHPFYPWKVTLSANFLALTPEKASISLTSTEKKGKGITFFHFSSELWQVKKGFPLNPYKEEPLCFLTKKEFLQKILETAEEDKNIKLVSHYEEKIITYFPKKQLFFQENSIEVCYPQATVAFPEEGIPRFRISL